MPNPEKIEFKIEKELTSEEREGRDKIEIIEKLSFTPHSKMELLLTFLGEKPATFLDLEAHLSNLPLEQRKVINNELSEQAEKALKDLKLFYEIKKSKSGEFSYIFISKTKEKLTELRKVFKKEDWGKAGLALGYPESAVKAYTEHFKERGRKPLEVLIEEVLLSLPEEERKQILEEGSHKFFPFGPSLEGWREEIKLARRYQEVIRKESPTIYKEIMNK